MNRRASKRKDVDITIGKWTRRIGVVLFVNLGVLVGVLLLAEVALRIVSPQVLRRDPKGFNEIFDAFYRPRANMNVQVSQPEGTTTWKTNSHGLRDGEIPYAGSPDTYRILGLGDSFTFGYTVEQEDTFLHRLEVRLNKRLPSMSWDIQRFETINAGVGGYGTLAQLHMLRLEGLRYEPDLVLLMFFVGNDVQDALREEEWQNGTVPIRPRQREPFLVAVRRMLGERSHLYAFVSVRLHELLVKTKLRHMDESTIEILNTVPSERLRHGWNIVENAIQEMQNEADEAGAEFLVALIPVRHQVQLAEWDMICSVYGLDRSRYELARPQAQLQLFLQEHGIDFVDLLAPLRQQEQPVYNTHEDSHFNARGHEATAQVLETRILRLLGDSLTRKEGTALR